MNHVCSPPLRLRSSGYSAAGSLPVPIPTDEGRVAMVLQRETAPDGAAPCDGQTIGEERIPRWLGIGLPWA